MCGGQEERRQFLQLLGGAVEWFRTFPLVIRGSMGGSRLRGVTCRCRRGHRAVGPSYPTDDKGDDKQDGNKNPDFSLTAYLHWTDFSFEIIQHPLDETSTIYNQQT